MLAGGQQTNGFVGFLVQARNYTDMFVPESSIHGTWEDDGNLLYRPLVCGKSMANTSVLYPNSATQKLSMDIADIMGDNEVLLYWVSPAEQDDAVTVVFWYTIVQQHRAHFFPVRGPVGNPSITPPTTDPPATTTANDPSSTATENNTGTMLTLVEIIGISVGGVAAAVAGIIAIILLVIIITMRCCIKQGYNPPRVVQSNPSYGQATELQLNPSYACGGTTQPNPSYGQATQSNSDRDYESVRDYEVVL